MLGNLIGGFIVIIVATSLLPVIANTIYTAMFYSNGTDTLRTNVTGATASVVQLITLFYALGLMSAGMAIAVSGLKQAGIM